MNDAKIDHAVARQTAEDWAEFSPDGSGGESPLERAKGNLARCYLDATNPKGACDHKWNVVQPVFLSGTTREQTGQVVPHEWCQRCGTLRHDFREELNPYA